MSYNHSPILDVDLLRLRPNFDNEPITDILFNIQYTSVISIICYETVDIFHNNKTASHIFLFFYINGAFAIGRGETAGKNQIYFYMPNIFYFSR